MDWHLEGWTGYSWNKELLPDPGALLAYLKGKNVKVTLNLHPADGCGAHETAYAEFSKFMGIEANAPTTAPASSQQVPTAVRLNGNCLSSLITNPAGRKGSN